VNKKFLPNDYFKQNCFKILFRVVKKTKNRPAMKISKGDGFAQSGHPKKKIQSEKIN